MGKWVHSIAVFFEAETELPAHEITTPELVAKLLEEAIKKMRDLGLPDESNRIVSYEVFKTEQKVVGVGDERNSN